MSFFYFTYMLDWRESVCLVEYNTLRLPAKSKTFVLLEKIIDLPELAKFFYETKEEFLFLGDGSNIVFRNTFSGTIVKVALKDATVIESGEYYWYVKVFAGQNWHDFVKDTIDAGMFGLENLALIPGTVGAAPVQNIGAYGLEIAQRVVSLTVYDFIEKSHKEINVEDCEFGYRSSIFKFPIYAHWLIIAVTFKLAKQWKPLLSHHELAKHFSGYFPSAKEIFDEVIKLRNKKLPNPTILGNVGSFFKNPVIDKNNFLQLLAKYPSIPSYPMVENQVKLSAAWLIEQCGFKGKRFGEVGVYDKQALVIVNFGQATAANVLELAGAISFAVNEKFGLSLEIEPRIV